MLAECRNEFGKKVKPFFSSMDFMRDAGWYDGNGSDFIGDRAAIDYKGARTGNHFVGFQLCFVNVIQDAFVWRNADEMVAELAISVFGGDDMFELHTLKCWVL